MTSTASSGLVLSTRTFGWGMLALLGTFLLNNYLTVALDWPGIASLFDAQAAASTVWVQIGIYAAGLGAAFAWILASRATTLRADSLRISNFNAYLVRGAFWAVFLVGLADMGISFLRVEGFLDAVLGADLSTQLGRPNYRGTAVHIPLMIAGFVLALFTRGLGFTWLALLIVIAELAIVITRFVFSYEQAFMGDLVRFWYAALFLFASAHTLLADTHVRVDVFYTSFSIPKKGLVNALGSIFLGMSVSWVILIVGMGSKAAIINSPLLNFEVSQSGFGMYTKYLMAGFLGVFAITMLVEFVSAMMSAVADYRGEQRQDEAIPDATAVPLH